MNGFVKILNANLAGREVFVDGFYTSSAGTVPGPVRVPYGVRTFETCRPDGTIDYRATVTVDRKKLTIRLEYVSPQGAPR